MASAYPPHLITQTEVNYIEHGAKRLLKVAGQLFKRADHQGHYQSHDGGDASLSDLLIAAWGELDLTPTEQRALLHVLQEARDTCFELQARRDAFGGE